MKKILVLTVLLNIFCANASHLYKESYYQNEWCKKFNGITEYRLNDDTRVDCLTKNYAVEFDFAPKWAESVGQALYYAQETNKQPAIVLILEQQSDERYYTRAKKLAQKYDIQLWYMKIPDEKYYQNAKQKSFKDILYDFVAKILRDFVNEILKSLFS